MNLSKYKIHTLLALIALVIASCDKEYESIDVADDKNVDEYIKKNNLDVLEYNNTGIFYKILTPGSGPALEYKNDIPLLYSIKTIDGSVSAQDTFANRVFTYVGYVNPEGLRIGIKEILKNSDGQIRLIIPSRLGYGRNGTAVFPGNTSIDVTVKVLSKASIHKYDDAVIKAYLAKNSMTGFTKAPSGLYYKIIQKGAGLPVLPESRIITKYNGNLLNGNSFDSSLAYNSLLEDLIEGWREGLPKISEGGKIRLVIPSSLGYGFNGSGSIPGFSCLDFEIEVTKVYP
jgi:FKBP-type peptidyl-prolyl cis-trans isomerase FkpA